MLKVLQSGIYTSVQDLGRPGYASIGVPVSGVMDQHSARMANLLLGNKETDAILEITLGNTSFLFEKEIFAIVSGARSNITLNGTSVVLNSVIKLPENAILKIGIPQSGVRNYLAVKGGFLTEKILGSRSFFKNITAANMLKKGDMLHYNASSLSSAPALSSVKIKDEHLKSEVLEVRTGPEFEFLSEKQQKTLLKMSFSISKDNNRMGYRLNELLENDLTSILTSAVLPGTVQLTPSGNLIVLMRDCQVTGGYPRILQLTDEAINCLAQKTTGHRIDFKLLSL